MDTKEERLVARLRHHNPTLTVTELHIGRVNRSKRNLVVEYLDSLQLNPHVESSPGLETVVSVDISSSTEQDDIFKKLLSFIRDVGIGDVSITSQLFDERQPEIDSAGSIQDLESSLKDYTPLNSEDIEELISRDKSESEFELILSRPRRCSSNELRRLHRDQSSRDVIGSILRVSEGRSHSSSSSLVQRSSRAPDRSSKTIQTKPNHPIQTFWSRAKKLFKRRKNPPKQTCKSQSQKIFNVIVSNDSIQTEVAKSKDEDQQKGYGILRNIKAVQSKANQVSLNTLQKRLEKVSRDVFSMKNKCPGIKTDKPPLDAYTQTTEKTMDEDDLMDCLTQEVIDTCSSTVASTDTYFTSIPQSNLLVSDANNLSQNSDSTTSSSSSVCTRCPTESEKEEKNSGALVAPPQTHRGMVTNLIPLYPNLAANMKRPVICELKPVGGPFFFRRLTAARKPSSHSTATSCLSTTTSHSVKSSRSTVTISSLSLPTNSQEEPSGSVSFEPVTYNRSKDPSISCCLVSTKSQTPFQRERAKKTQTVEPPLKATEVNTSQIFKLPKITQTLPKATNVRPKKKRKIPNSSKLTPAVGTQTVACSNSTSCSELITMKSCGTKTENEVETVDKENLCDLLTKKATETKETNSEILVFKCETCLGQLDKPSERKRKSGGKQKSDRGAKRGLCWGQYPDGNFGFGQSYAPGKVFPVFSLATGFSVGSPFNLPPVMDKGQVGGNQPCPKICNLFGGKKKALMEELKKQKMELMQMRMVLVAINEELLGEYSETSSDEYFQSSEDNYQSSDSQVRIKNHKKVTFSNPLVNERTLNYSDFY